MKILNLLSTELDSINKVNFFRFELYYVSNLQKMTMNSIFQKGICNPFFKDRQFLSDQIRCSHSINNDQQ
jgi:hypothetical protein